MPPTLPDPLIARLSDFLAAQIGLHFSRERWGELEQKIAAAAPALGMSNAESCAHWLLSASLTRHQTEILASHLTVGETYFLREKRSFEVLEEHVLPELLRARDGTERRLRIWSAGCCTGEEPYSIAMLLDRLIPNPNEWNITILATDINPEFLRKAAEGLYGEWSFRDTPSWPRERYFSRRKNGRFELQPHVRKKVTFSYLNLASDVFPSLSNNTNAMDVILCRNVLMYFTAAQAKKVIENLRRSLVDGGWLIVSATETSSILFSRFTAVEFPGVVFYRNVAGAASQVLVPASSAPAFGQMPVALPASDPLFLPDRSVGGLAQPVPLQEAQREEAAATLHEPGRPAEADLGEPHPQGRDECDTLCRTARACANAGDLTTAIEWCEKAIAADKLNAANHYLLATIRQEQGQSDVAVHSLMRALYLEPNFVLAHFALANLRLTQGRRQEAERHFDNALALLHARPQDDILPESDGLTAGRLGEIIASVRSSLPRVAIGRL